MDGKSQEQNKTMVLYLVNDTLLELLLHYQKLGNMGGNPTHRIKHITNDDEQKQRIIHHLLTTWLGRILV